MSYKKAILCLGICWAVSILIRIPNLNRPLSKHHEFNMAMVLNVCKSWDINGGPAHFNFTPVTFYGRQQDLIYIKSSSVINNKAYYASLGPGQFILPYYFSKILGLEFNVINIQFFAMILHLLCSLILFAIFYKIFKEKNDGIFFSFMGVCIFISLPNMLWFFSNAYSHETLALPFCFGLLYYGVKEFYSKETITLKDNLVILPIVFWGIFSDWFLLICVMCYLLLKLFFFIKTKRSKYLHELLFISFTALCSMLLIIYLFSKELGWQNFKDLMMSKFQSRTIEGNSDTYSFSKILKLWVQHFLTSYHVVLVMVLCFALLYLKKVEKKVKIIIATTILCPLLYFVLLAEFSAENDYAVMKFSFAIILMTLLFLHYMKTKKKYLLVIFCSLILANIAVCYYVNRVGSTAQNGDVYAEIKEQGLFIKNNTNSDEFVICSFDTYNYTALIYYAERNIVFIDADSEIESYKRKNMLSKVRVFKNDNGILNSYVIK
jgi:hypothetical protein